MDLHHAKCKFIIFAVNGVSAPIFKKAGKTRIEDVLSNCYLSDLLKRTRYLMIFSVQS